MFTTDYKKPLKEEFRITKTDIKNALKAALSSNCYKLNNEFQAVLDYYNSSLDYQCIERSYNEMGVLDGMLVRYVWCHFNVVFHKTNVLGKWVYASNYENTTSDDFIYTLMNTIIPIAIQEGVMSRVLDIDSFED